VIFLFSIIYWEIYWQRVGKGSLFV